MNFRELLRTEFQPYGELSPKQLSQLEAHHERLMRWNQRLNLTRLSDDLEVAQFHYCESLFVGRVLPPGSPNTGLVRIGDLGSGAGFPGIPLAILRPDAEVVLVESDQRKAVFLREAARDLPNVAVSAIRFESFHGSFDWIVSRAVSPSEVLSSGLAANFAILMSPDDAPEGSEMIRLPWGRDRALVISRGTVSRETPRS